MENFDFETSEKLSVFYTYKVQPKKFVFSNIVGNILFSVYLIFYMS